MDCPQKGKHLSRDFTIAVSYIESGLVPLSGYFFFASVHSALIGSVVTLLALPVFGYIKGQFTMGSTILQRVASGGLGRIGSDRYVRDREGDWVADTPRKQPTQIRKGTSNGDESRSLD